MPHTSSIPPPDLGANPLTATVECTLSLPPGTVFSAWTRDLDRWLAAPGTVLLRPEVDTAFYFESHHGDSRVSYYGRILRLESDRLLEITWLSPGTRYTETILLVELTPAADGTTIRLTHHGFPNEELRAAHQEVWPTFLHTLEAAFT
jgi:uncharacterized protein YndB with AHSA1/START domain